MTKVVRSAGPVVAEKRGGLLVAEVSYKVNGKNPAQRIWRPEHLDPALAAWFASAADGDQVEVFVGLDAEGQFVQARMVNPPEFVPFPSDPARVAAVGRLGGAPNPYTFIPAPPRAGMPPGLENGPAAPHGVVDTDSQWSGWLTHRLVTRTPLLLPDAEAAHEDAASKHKTYPVRVGRDGRPLLHGASFKGALRSAYEAVTDSRLAVFREHDRPLWYRMTAEGGSHVQPARVESDGHGRLVFRLCDAIRVPLYDKREAEGQEPGRPGGRRRGPATPAPKAVAVGRADARIARPGGTRDWRRLHKKPVACTLRTTERGAVVAKVALAEDERSLGQDAGEPTRGWLSVTGQTIENKTSERLFVANGKKITVEERHHEMWRAVLASYHEAAGRQESGGDAGAASVPRSPHIVIDGEVPRRLEAEELVYLELDGGTVIGVWPVYISRRPYPAVPSELLDPSLRPTVDPDELSPADRLFGWAAPQAGAGRASASGYRGRVRVCSVRCDTEDWLPADFPKVGVTLAPLSSPKPAQFRFYEAKDDTGSPMDRGAAKDKGYGTGAGLRGRKAYWYPSDAPDGYWKPETGEVGGRFREWQALNDAKPSQTSTHLGWVRVGAKFTVRLFIDAVPGPELGPLIWLASQDGCALRLGAGKPLGFGAVSVEVDWKATELRTGDALLGCWLGLARPDPCASEQVQALAADFEEQAKSGQGTLKPVLDAFRKVAAGLAWPGLAAYPRTGPVPEAETYRWFVANEQIADKKVQHGYALPHVLEDNQSLPYLQPGR